MAIYKPSNFYPSMDEIDMLESNTFECQVNTDGSKVKAYKLKIYSDAGVLLYENIGDFDKPVGNNEFARIEISPYQVDLIQIEKAGYEEEEWIDAEGKHWITTITTKNKLKMSKNYISLFPNKMYNDRITDCPYCLYNVIENEMYWFCLKEEIEGQEPVFYDIIDLEYDIKKDDSTTLILPNNFTEIQEGAIYSICLKNNFDYKWTVRLYEEKIGEISEDYDNKTFVTSGYITGTVNGVVWYNNNAINFKNLEQAELELSKQELIDNYIKENNYIELRANENNSYMFEKYIKKGMNFSGQCYSDGQKIIIDKKDNENIFFDFYNLNIEDLNIVFMIDKNDANDNLKKLIQLEENTNYTNTNIQPYLDTYENNGVYYFIEKIKKCYEDANGNWCILIDNKQLLQFFTGIYDITVFPTYNAYKNGKDLKEVIDSYSTFYDNKYPDKENNWNSLSSNFCQSGIVSEIDYTSFYLFKSSNYNDYYSGNVISFNDENITSIDISEISFKVKTNVSAYRISGTGPYYNKYQLYLFLPKDLSNKTENEIIAKVLEFQYGKSEYCIRIKNLYSNGSLEPDKAISTNEAFPSDFGGSVQYNILINNDNDAKTILNIIAENAEGVGKCVFNLEIPKITNFKNHYFFGGVLCPLMITNSDKLNVSEMKIIGECIEEVSNDIKIGDVKFPFEINFIQREKIYSTNINLGTNHNMNQILMEKDFNTYLKNNSDYHLYLCDNKNTNNVCYVTPNDEIQVGRYIRFPTIDGLIYNQYNYNKTDNSIDTGYLAYDKSEIVKEHKTDKTFKYNFPSYSYDEKDIMKDIGIYVRNSYFLTTEISNLCMNSETKDYFNNNSNFILYKIIGYDPDTGEVRLENNVYRTLTRTDIYEIWEREEESGETTESFFTRKLPISTDIDKNLNICGEIIADIKNENSTNDRIYIQPNINMKSDEFYSPQLKFKNGDTIDVKYIYDTKEAYNLENRDKTINKLDNSQWIVETSDYNHPIKCGSEYSIYSAFVDSFPENYFYARDLANIKLKYTNVEDYNKYGLEGLEYYPEINMNVSFGYNIIKMMNCIFIGEYTGSTAIKKYRYKLYDHNDELIKDSDNIYSNELVFKVSGLRNNLVYKINLEIEDQYGYIYTYNETFRCIISVIEEQFGIQFNIKEADNGNGLMFYLDAGNDNELKADAGMLLEAGYSTIEVYKCRVGHNYEYVTTLELYNDNAVEWQENQKVLGAIDYNVVNDTWYEYIFILKSQNIATENYIYSMSYTLLKQTYKTCFNRWSIADIEKINDEEYSVGDIWMIKYNLETGEITNNTSVTKWDTLGKYSQVSIGERGYDSSSISCLLGDINKYTTVNNDNTILIQDNYNEYNSKDKYSNNADKLEDWKNFCCNGNLKLLQDYKGNKWIVQILENPTHNINISTMQQITTISFNWAEVMDTQNISIVGLIKPWKNIPTLEEEVSNKLHVNWDSNVITKDGKIYVNSYTGPKDVELEYIPNYTTYVLETTCYQDIDGNWIIINPFTKGGTNTEITSFSIAEGVNLEVRCIIEDNVIIDDNTHWDGLFYNCYNLQTINLDTSNNLNIIPDSVISLRYTFYGCNNLETEIIFDNDISDESIIDVTEMFGTILVDESTEDVISMSRRVMGSDNMFDIAKKKVHITFGEHYENNIQKGIVWWSKLCSTFKNREKYNFVEFDIVNKNNGYQEYTEYMFNLDDWTVNNNVLMLKNQSIKQYNLIFPEYIIDETNDIIYYDYKIDLNSLQQTCNFGSVYFSSGVTYNEETTDANIFKNKTFDTIYINSNNEIYVTEKSINGIILLTKDYKEFVTCNQKPIYIEFFNKNEGIFKQYNRICDYAFYNCGSLSVIDLNNCLIIGSHAFDKACNKDLYISQIENGYLGSIDNTNSSITLKIPNSIIKIGDDAFADNGDFIKLVCINKDVLEDTKNNNWGLSTATILWNCIDAGYYGNANITDIVWKVDSDYVLHIEKTIELDKVLMYETGSTINDNNYSDKLLWHKYEDKIKSIIVDEGIGLCGYVCCNCSDLQNVVFGKNVYFQGFCSFKNCINLKTIDLSQCVTLIAEDNNKKYGILWINDATFYNCTSLQEVILPDGNTKGYEYITIDIDRESFYNCRQLEYIVSPQTKNTIETGYLSIGYLSNETYCASIGPKITGVGIFAFGGCSSLKHIFVVCGLSNDINSYAFCSDEFVTLEIDKITYNWNDMTNYTNYKNSAPSVIGLSPKDIRWCIGKNIDYKIDYDNQTVYIWNINDTIGEFYGENISDCHPFDYLPISNYYFINPNDEAQEVLLSNLPYGLFGTNYEINNIRTNILEERSPTGVLTFPRSITSIPNLCGKNSWLLNDLIYISENVTNIHEQAFYRMVHRVDTKIFINNYELGITGYPWGLPNPDHIEFLYRKLNKLESTQVFTEYLNSNNKDLIIYLEPDNGVMESNQQNSTISFSLGKQSAGLSNYCSDIETITYKNVVELRGPFCRTNKSASTAGILSWHTDNFVPNLKKIIIPNSVEQIIPNYIYHGGNHYYRYFPRPSTHIDFYVDLPSTSLLYNHECWSYEGPATVHWNDKTVYYEQGSTIPINL